MRRLFQRGSIYIAALALCLVQLPTLAHAEPLNLSIAGELRPSLTGINQSDLRGFEQRKITHITFHHEGFAGNNPSLFARASKARLRQSTSQRVQNIHAYHAREAGLGMFAYHYAIGPDGTIAKGRPVHLKPSTKSRALSGSKLADFDGHFAVVMLGDFNHERMTPAARQALIRVMSEAQRAFAVPMAHIQPHKSHAHTACPGTHILAEAEVLAEQVSVFSLQSELSARGCGALTADGQIGPATRRAWRRFTRQNNPSLPNPIRTTAMLEHLLQNREQMCH